MIARVSPQPGHLRPSKLCDAQLGGKGYWGKPRTATRPSGRSVSAKASTPTTQATASTSRWRRTDAPAPSLQGVSSTKLVVTVPGGCTISKVPADPLLVHRLASSLTTQLGRFSAAL